MKRYINSLLCVLAACGALCAQEAAQPAAPAKDYAVCLAAWDHTLDTLQTDFTQITAYDGLEISRSYGRIYYAKQGTLLRLDNLQDGEVAQSALTDKKTILMLDENGKKISRMSWKDWADNQPNQALFDFGNYAALLQRHRVEILPQSQEGRVFLRLTPKEKGQEYILEIGLQEKDCFPFSILLRAELLTTAATLQHTQRNTVLPKDLFKGIEK